MSRVVVLYNDVTSNQDAAALDVLTQCREIEQSLIRLGYEPIPLACTLDLATAQRALSRARPQLVFNLVESLGGTDRLMAAATMLLDAMQLPYTGSGTQAILLSGDKLRAKHAMVAEGIPTPAWFDAATQTWLHADDVVFNDAHVICKSVYEHASFGMGNDAVQPYRNADDLSQMLAERNLSTGHIHLAERFIAGREFNLSVLQMDGQPTVLAAAEIDFHALPPELPHIVGLRAKWQEDSIEFQMTPRRFDFPPQDAGLVAELSDLARRCWKLFELRGYARVDFRVDRDGCPYVLEVNVNPCLSSDAGFVAAAQQSHLDYDSIIQAIVQQARHGESHLTWSSELAVPRVSKS